MPGHGHEKSLENVSMERHGYSDSNPKIDLSDINFRYNESELIQVLGEFFYKEYREKLPDRHGRKRAFNKAESLIKGDFDKGNTLNTFKYQEGQEKALKQAISKGYIWKIEIKKPWHPKFFFNYDKVKTFPFQHDAVVLWTGQDKERFFSNAGKIDILESKDFDEFYNPNSIFNQKGIRRGTRHPDKPSKWSSHNEAVYLAHSLAVGNNYGAAEYAKGGGAILEFKIPSKLIHMNHTAGDRADKIMSTLKESKQFFNSPLGYYKNNTEFQYLDEKLSLDYCTGIWDWRRDEKTNPNFVTVEEFHKKFFRRHPFRVPWNSNMSKLDREPAKKLREKKLRESHFYQTCEVVEEFLGYAEDFAEVIEIKEGSTMYELNRKYDISINEFNGRKYPSYWYDGGKDFIPNRAIGRLEKKYKLFKDLYSKPLEWEDKVRREWKREGEKYYSDLFIIENSISGVIQKFELFEKRLETYYASLEASIFHLYSGTNNLKKTAQHLKKDIRRMKKDLKSMENS